MRGSREPLELGLYVSRSGAADVGRGALTVTTIGLAVLIGAIVALAIGLATQSPRAGILSGLVATAFGFRLEAFLSRRMRAAPERRTVRIDATHVHVDGLVTLAREDVRSCRYDPVLEVLWLGGVLGWPLLAMEAPAETAVRIRDALGIPDRGVRTFAAVSIPASLPFVGWLWVLVGGCASAFALVMWIAGPLSIALPATLVALPLAASMFPSRIELGETEITRRWLVVAQRVSLLEVRRVAVESDALVLETDRSVTRWRLRFERGTAYGGLLSEIDDRGRQRVRANARVLTELVQARTGDAIARVFE